MNWRAVRAMYFHEMDRTRRTILQSILAPVISTSLYFIVFGSAIIIYIVYMCFALNCIYNVKIDDVCKKQCDILSVLLA